jgi:hypothetical protein
MNLMYIARCRLCSVSYYVFFYKLNAYCVFYPAVTGELMSIRLSLLGATVATDDFGPSLLSYHSSITLVAMDRLSVSTVTYGPLL